MSTTTDNPVAGGSATVVEAVPADVRTETAIAIAVDTGYVVAHSDNVQQGIYMIDNRKENGSSSEGTLELHTVCNPGDRVGFKVYAIDSLANRGDSVIITGLKVSQGSVFSSDGYPQPQPDEPQYWIGRASQRGSQTYQIRIQITSEEGTKYNVSWDPFITVAGS
jgi:hypothetical protein